MLIKIQTYEENTDNWDEIRFSSGVQKVRRPLYIQNEYVTYIRPEAIASVSSLYNGRDKDNKPMKIAHLDTFNSEGHGLNGQTARWYIDETSYHKVISELSGGFNVENE